MKKKDFIKTLSMGESVFASALSLESGVYDGNGATLKLGGRLNISCDDTVIKNFTLIGSMLVTGKNCVIENCKIKGYGSEVRSCAEGFVFRRNSIESSNVVLESGSSNCLISENDTDEDIVLNNAFNCSVVLNNARNIVCNNNVNIYLAENHMSGCLSLRGNDYLLADRNTYFEAVNDKNRNHNGDNVTDINVRAECGALPEIQPHTNRELFVGMERQEYVRDPSINERLSINSYLPYAAKNSDVVIIPPGAYTVSSNSVLCKECSNTKIFAYGVYIEMTEYGSILDIDSARDIEIYGLTVGYTKQSCRQAHVLSQLSDTEFLIVDSAGFEGSIAPNAGSLPTPFKSEVVHQGDLYTSYSMKGASVVKNSDGTMTVSFDGICSDAGHITVGDMLLTRIGGRDKHTVRINNSKNIMFSDLVIYGYTAALAVVGDGMSEDLKLLRYHDTVHSGSIIDKETYDRYKAYESKYGVDFGMSVDSMGRYRATPPLTGSVDAVHVIGTKNGFNISSSVLEQMADDGANHRAISSRLAALWDNGDGTATLRYKDSLAYWYFAAGDTKMRSCVNFSAGDTVLVYNPHGKIVTETKCITDAKKIDDIDITVEGKSFTMRIHEILVRSDEVDFDALCGFDIEDNHYSMNNKFIVDNLSRNCVGFVLDNVTIRNTRSRGVLFKTTNGTVKNCTLKNLAHTGILFSIETEWGESTISRDSVIKNCIIDNVGFINNYDFLLSLAPISICGLSQSVSKESLLYKNILIEGNRFKNNSHSYFINVNSAQNVRIINNTFEAGRRENTEKYQKVINIDTAMDVEISGNKYSKYLKSVADGIDAKNYKNIYGTDIILEDDIY